jgi:hypothetical protein
MAETSFVYAGTVRSAAGGSGGIFGQTAGDQRWEALTNGLPDETQVHAITVHPTTEGRREIVGLGCADQANQNRQRAPPRPNALALNPITDAVQHEGHKRYTRRVDHYRQNDERQTPSPW